MIQCSAAPRRGRRPGGRPAASRWWSRSCELTSCTRTQRRFRRGGHEAAAGTVVARSGRRRGGGSRRWWRRSGRGPVGGREAAVAGADPAGQRGEAPRAGTANADAPAGRTLGSVVRSVFGGRGGGVAVQARDGRLQAGQSMSVPLLRWHGSRSQRLLAASAQAAALSGIARSGVVPRPRAPGRERRFEVGGGSDG
eukprot:SAG11_NODE_2063_length_3870_cov_4.378679_2_plen_196_part_00